MVRPPTRTSRVIGSRPSASRDASAAHTGTGRGTAPSGDHSTSATEGPCRGSKKHGGRAGGGSRPPREARPPPNARPPPAVVSLPPPQAPRPPARGSTPV